MLEPTHPAALETRPRLVDYFLILAGAALSYLLLALGNARPGAGSPPQEGPPRQLGHLRVEPGPQVDGPFARALVLTFPDLLRLHEGIILLWPLFFGLQRLLGRPAGLTSGEWLWVFSWLGTALVTCLDLWNRWGTMPELVLAYASWPPVVWYAILVPSMALIAAACALFGFVTRARNPWTHGFGLVLAGWPVLPLLGILTLGKIT